MSFLMNFNQTNLESALTYFMLMVDLLSAF